MSPNRPDTAERVEGELVDALLAATRALVAVAVRSLADLETEVTLPQFRTLMVLAERGPQRGIDISAELGVDPSTGTRMCERLVRKGLVRRQRPAGNRREVRLTLSPAGRELVREVTGRRRAELRRMATGLSDTEQQPLIAALRRLADAAGELPEQGWWLGWSSTEAGTSTDASTNAGPAEP